MTIHWLMFCNQKLILHFWPGLKGFSILQDYYLPLISTYQTVSVYKKGYLSTI